MTWYEKIEALGSGALTAAAGAAMTGALWVVRTVLTSKTQIALVLQEIADREALRMAQRAEDLEAHSAIRSEIAQMRADITDIKVQVASIRRTERE